MKQEGVMVEAGRLEYKCDVNIIDPSYPHIIRKTVSSSLSIEVIIYRVNIVASIQACLIHKYRYLLLLS